MTEENNNFGNLAVIGHTRYDYFREKRKKNRQLLMVLIHQQLRKKTVIGGFLTSTDQRDVDSIFYK